MLKTEKILQSWDKKVSTCVAFQRKGSKAARDQVLQLSPSNSRAILSNLRTMRNYAGLCNINAPKWILRFEYGEDFCRNWTTIAKRDKDLGERWYNRLEKGRQSTAWYETQPIGVEYRLIDRSVQPIARPKCWWGPRQSRDTSISPNTHPSNHPLSSEKPTRGICRVSSTPPSLFCTLSFLPSSLFHPPRGRSVSIIMARARFQRRHAGISRSKCRSRIVLYLIDELFHSEMRGWKILKADSVR